MIPRAWQPHPTWWKCSVCGGPVNIATWDTMAAHGPCNATGECVLARPSSWMRRLLWRLQGLTTEVM